MRKITMLMVCLCVVNYFGCAATFMSKTDRIYPVKNAKDVEIFFSQTPDKSYHEIGFIMVDKYPPLSPIPYTNNKIKEFIRASAAKNGGDAVINIKDDMLKFSGTVVIYQ
ncbi:MAG: hypothetical protein OMM_07949 [Candidatus Magnetoglobus multicellularis str. Araruama]|uniref:Lipoprotein n=1 Tax=Candidatus Magnetoglobus multicellularis str. Araruama TaxID=890399 RepID=A0A1V1PAA0_9BACT|nr:MAG: hypothetical protein OMM_07949 [Candidatus Magnetoglobus multicellularis str. Araruama]